MAERKCLECGGESRGTFCGRSCFRSRCGSESRWLRGVRYHTSAIRPQWRSTVSDINHETGVVTITAEAVNG